MRRRSTAYFIIVGLVISIVLNIFLSINYIKTNNSKITNETTNGDSSDFKVQPSKVEFFIGREAIFDKLPDDSEEIVFLGTSMTQNFELYELFKNPAIRNRGINGDITKGMLVRLNEVIRSKPKKIFIEAGINDILNNYYPDSIKLNFETIILKIQAESPTTKIYVQSIFPSCRRIHGSKKLLRGGIVEFNKYLEKFCLEENLTFIDLYTDFSKENCLNNEYDCGDGLHLNGKGYLLWFELIRKYVNDPVQ